MTIYTIYLITNLINNKKYVGQTRKKPNLRFNTHKAGKKSIISKAIKKYGANNFKFEVIYQTLDLNHVDFLECHFIKEHNSLSFNGGHGYNIEIGGNCNKIVSDITRMKLSKSLMGNKHTLGFKHSEETKQKHSINTMGSNNPNYGKSMSDEQKLKISIARKGFKHPIVTCPHCGKEGGNNMTRYHFDNCKFNQTIISMTA